jgi:hypothetical protein
MTFRVQNEPEKSSQIRITAIFKREKQIWRVVIAMYGLPEVNPMYPYRVDLVPDLNEAARLVRFLKEVHGTRKVSVERCIHRDKRAREQDRNPIVVKSQ